MVVNYRQCVTASDGSCKWRAYLNFPLTCRWPPFGLGEQECSCFAQSSIWPLTMTDELLAILGVKLTETIRLSRRSARLEFSSICSTFAERRCLPFGAGYCREHWECLGPTYEHLMPSLTMLLRRRRNSAVAPQSQPSTRLKVGPESSAGSRIGAVDLIDFEELDAIHLKTVSRHS